jgi:PAS domain S-box-containing protein
MLSLSIPILALFGAVVPVLRVESETRQANEMPREAVIIRTRVQQMRVTLLDAETGVFAYLASGNRNDLAHLERARATLLTDTLAWLTFPGEQKAPVDAIRRSIREQVATLDRVQEARGDSAATAREAAVINQQRNAFRGLLDQTLDVSDRMFNESAEVRRQRYRNFTILAIVCCCLGPFGGLLINLYLTNDLVRRVQQLGVNARLLAQGQPLKDLPVGHDEIGQLSRDMEDAAVLLSSREAGLKESEMRFRQLFDAAPIPYHETNCEGVIQRVNKAECDLLGYSAEQIVGRAAWDFISPEERQDARRQALRAIESGLDQTEAERDYLLSDGSRITVETHENLIRGENGAVTGIRSALMDVTEHKTAVLAAKKVEQYARELRNKNDQLARAAAAAKAATEAKSRFLAGMSHELRTPLNSIIGFSELMYDGKVGDIAEEHREFLADILTSARHLLQLINDILDLSKIESGKFEFRPEPTDISRLAHEVCDVISPLAAKKHIRLEIGVPPKLPAVIDPARVKQVMYNYLSNAVKFTPDNGRVTCVVMMDGDGRFRIEVEDTGVGIAAEDMPRLFSEFEQLARGNRPGQGAGLGLALTRRLVEGQGGSVAVRSVVEQGSVFSAILPVKPPTKAAAEKGVPAARTILVVEDNVQESRRLCQMLREGGYQVEVAYSRAEAAARCASRAFDGITLDLLLPDASGWDLLRDIRAGGLNVGTPVIVVSVAGADGFGSLYPIQDCLTKPVQPASLLEALERASVPAHRDRVVLVVDDDDAACRLMQSALGGLGYRAVCRGNGEAGLAALESEHPAAVLLDLVMPGVDGFQFLQRMRAGDGPQPPVIVWTSKDLTWDERRQLQVMAEKVVSKRDGTPTSVVEQIKMLVG